MPQAQALAARLGLNLAPETAELLLVLTPERLELREVASRTGPVFVDFSAQRAISRREGGRRLEVARAVGLKGGHRPTVLDATAGLGQDAFALAAGGCCVTMIERHPVVAALLADGLARAQRDPELAMVAVRLCLIVGDALELMRQSTPRPEAVLLDPMYPHQPKRALPKKELRLFRQLVGDDTDADALLDAALALATRRVAVKRPRHAPPLAGRQPSAVILGKTIRFDLYLV